MAGNGKCPQPVGAVSVGGTLVGQPFAFANVTISLNGQFACHCRPGNEPMAIIASAPVTCPHCGKTYRPVLPVPPGAQVAVLQTAAPDTDQVPS